MVWSAPLAAQTPDAGNLRAALTAAQGGETIRLAPGAYDRLELRGMHFAAPVIITSADPADPAVFSGVDIRDVRNLVFDSVVFDYTFRPGQPVRAKPFDFREVQDLTLRNVVFDGDVARGQSEIVDGFGWATGLSVSNAAGVIIESSRFFGFQRGLVIAASDNVVLRGNEIYDMRSEGMNILGTQGLVIEDNYIHDFRRAPGSGDHADMIQFWTNRSKRPSTDVVIRGNVLMSAAGSTTQSIFMRNEAVDQGQGGDEMFYRNITIENNVIVNGHLHGIAVGQTDGLIITGNTVLRNPAAAQGEDRTQTNRVPRIRVSGAARDVTIANNIAGRVPDAQPGWQVAGNLLAQDISPMQPNYYVTLFRDPLHGDPGRLDSFAYLPAVPAGVGAALLRGR